jgi:hypothetical protein
MKSWNRKKIPLCILKNTNPIAYNTEYAVHSLHFVALIHPYLLAVPLRDIIQPANVAYTGTLCAILLGTKNYLNNIH